MKYNAFISYSHSQDTHLAPSLETALEKFAKPTFKRRALNIFRDSNDLSVSPDLWGKIEDGLNQSEYFIYFASPRAAKSHYCNKEVEHWKQHKSIDNFLIALTDGEWVWDQSASDFDWSKTTAIPKSLSGVFKNEPLFIDFRDKIPEDKLNLDNPDFKAKVVSFAATLHGKSVGDMVGEAVKQHKRTMRIRNAAIVVLSFLLIFALYQKSVAESETKKALLSSYIAFSQAQFSEDPTKSLRLAEYAYNYAKDNDLPTFESENQLIKVFYSGNGFYQDLENNIPKIIETDQLNNYQYYNFNQLTNQIFQNTPDDDYLAKSEFRHFDPIPEKSMYLIAGGKLTAPRLYFYTYNFDSELIFDSVDFQIEGFSGFNSYILDVAISSNGLYSVIGSGNGKAVLINNEITKNDRTNNDIFKNKAVLKSSNRNAIEAVAFTEFDSYVVTSTRNTKIDNNEIQNMDNAIVFWKTEPFPYIELNSPKIEGKYYAIGGAHYVIPLDEEVSDMSVFHSNQKLFDKENNLIAEFPNAKGAIYDATLSPNGENSVSYKGIFNINGDQLISLNLDFTDNPGVAYCFSNDGEFLKVSYLDGLERIFALNPEFILNRLNNIDTMGTIAKLNENDKKRFLINN